MESLESDYKKLFRVLTITRSPFATVSTVFADRLILKINSCINDVVVVETNKVVANHLVELLQLGISETDFVRPSVCSVAVEVSQWLRDLAKIEQVFRYHIGVAHSNSQAYLESELPTQSSCNCTLIIADQHPHIEYRTPYVYVLQIWNHKLFFESYSDAVMVRDNIDSILNCLLKTNCLPRITSSSVDGKMVHNFEIADIVLKFCILANASALNQFYVNLHAAIRN